MSADPEDLPPHLAGQDEQMTVMVPRPIEVSPVHFFGKGRCHAAFVVDVISEDPLSPEFTIDLVFFAPRERRNDRFVNDRSVPGTQRWANEVSHAPREQKKDLTWHYPGRACLPEAVLELMGEQPNG